MARRHLGASLASVTKALGQWEAGWRSVQAEAKGPGAHFSKPEHWDAFYEKKARATTDPRAFEWYLDLDEAGPEVIAALRRSPAPTLNPIPHPNPRRNLNLDDLDLGMEVLHVGCGFSGLGAHIASGLGPPTRVVNVDAAPFVVAEMQNRATTQLPKELLKRCRWESWDLGTTPAAAAGHKASYDAVVDKGFLCATLFGGYGHAAVCLWGCIEALRPGGVLLQIAEDPPEQRLDLLRAALPSRSWEVTSTALEGTSGFTYYLYGCRHITGTLSSRCAVVSDGDMSGLVACIGIDAGEVVMEERAAAVWPEPNPFTIQRGPGVHLELAGDMYFTNHSFDPSCEVRFVEDDDDLTLQLVALRRIEIADAITYNYETTEANLMAPFVDAATGQPVEGWSETPST
uniref:SET domain-containing protein n=1 Tax=Phaeomonas parva TaxID=124430 RepID=A0A7S1XP37_9STRA|mmetsp:Transcript_20797/g.63279  ORF Transcript_20797/g.63279 Transcript_20797/m.63279 type:complete len:401 (+) Transcript_20797:213-1415(+)